MFVSLAPPASMNAILQFCCFLLLVQWLIRYWPTLPGGVVRSDCGPRHIYFEICLTAAPVSESQSKWGARRAPATTAGRALMAVREMAGIEGVYLDGLQPWPRSQQLGTRGRSRVGRGPRQTSGRASFCYRQTCWPLTTAHLLEGSCGRDGGGWGTLVTTGGRGGLGAGGAGRMGSVGGVGA